MFWRYCNIPEGDIMSKKDLYKFKCSIRCCCNSMLVNKLFAASSIPTSFCTLKGLLNDRCEKRQMQIKADFKNMPQRCSITCDVCCSQTGFLGLSKRMSSHSRDLIRRETEIIVDTYRVLLRKVFKVVADGGSNMVKGFRDIISIDYPVRFSSTYWLFCTRSSASDNVDVQEEFCYSFWLSNFLCSHQSIQTPDNSQGGSENACEKQIMLSSSTRWQLVDFWKVSNKIFNALKYWSSFMDTDAEATGILALEGESESAKKIIKIYFSQSYGFYQARTPGNAPNFGGEEGVGGVNQRNPTGATGSFFGEHFLMGGERYDVAKPDTTTFLFGDNSDLELLGNKPVKVIPYSLNKGVAETVNVLNSLVNVRRDSVKFVRAESSRSSSSSYRLEFVFDCDVPCYIQIHFCAKEVVDADYIQIVSKYPSIDSSQKFHFDAKPAQAFDKFTFKAHRYDLKMLHYEGGQYFPVVIEIRTANEEGKFSEQVQTTLCSIERSADQASTIILKPLKQKLIVNGVTYLMQEIYGLENKDPTLKRHSYIALQTFVYLQWMCRDSSLQLKTVRSMMGSLNAAGAGRLRQEALTLMEALNGPYQNGEHPQPKTSVSLRCKDLEGGRDIVSSTSHQRSAARNLSFVERIKNKDSSEPSVVRMSGNTITRAHPTAASSPSSSIAGISNHSSLRSSRTVAGSNNGSVDSERLPLSQTLEISENLSTKIETADITQFSVETPPPEIGSKSPKDHEHHASLVRVDSQQSTSTMSGSVVVVDKVSKEGDLDKKD
uniref:RING-type E3 ubiquitin transferase n=1 Tax=Ditylenchus dipsaci TaxID=166011 RepID=A0A915EAA7_9BILA